MRIVQTVFGVFHHFELARQLHQRGHLERIYSTWPWARLKREGLPRGLVSTYPWVHTPEMLLQRYGVRNTWLLDQISYANALSFDSYTSRQLRHKPAPDALIAISGSSLTTGAELQGRGTRLICDRGSSHQRYQEQIVSEEYRRWGVDRPVTDIRDILREEKIYAIADAITVPSTFAARSFLESGIDPAKLHVMPLGARLEQFTPVGTPPPDRFEVLFAGSVGLRKGRPLSPRSLCPAPVRTEAPSHRRLPAPGHQERSPPPSKAASRVPRARRSSHPRNPHEYKPRPCSAQH